ncbi:hypothetical protein JTE90_011548 [Oedothorax gibbosus]|uniref:Uncharacterized protein n=1 Tax=Oedothorax gibbosus TaxID=931172 RepID=A0AAV6UL86_9ARAC|nr:hypothetical protein JTE90_011548 [Oedothorax gibbosus]
MCVPVLANAKEQVTKLHLIFSSQSLYLARTEDAFERSQGEERVPYPGLGVVCLMDPEQLSADGAVRSCFKTDAICLTWEV